MTQKQVYEKINFIKNWFSKSAFSDDIFAKIYNECMTKVKTRFPNDFERQFIILLNLWEKVAKTDYMHTLEIDEKIYKMRFSLHLL